MTLVNVLFYLSRQSLFIRTNRQPADHGGTVSQLTNPFIGKHNSNSACFVQTYRADTQTGTLGRRLYNHNVLWKQDSQVFFFFAHGPCNNIHQFEGCFLIGQVSLNGFKNFNSCIVEYLNFISLSTKTLQNILFWEKVVIGQYSTKCPVWLSAMQCTSLVLMVFLPTVMLLKWFSVYQLLAAATQINANNQELN